MSLPGAAELFRSTVSGEHEDDTRDIAPSVAARAASPTVQRAIGAAVRSSTLRALPGAAGVRAAPEMVREERLCVAVPSDLFLELERARAVLAREHGLPVRRAEVVTAALELLLDDLDAHAAQSLLVRALSAD